MEGTPNVRRSLHAGRKETDTLHDGTLAAITTVEGEGLNSPSPLNLSYTVPQGCTAGIQYVRAGNAAGGTVNVTLSRTAR